MRVGLGFEQQRIHAHIGHRACGQRLKILGGADFAAGCIACMAVGGVRVFVCCNVRANRHAGVVAHVLRLEGRDLVALAGVPAA